jgi:hypothetical protein
MSYLGGMDHDERAMLHDLINVFVCKLNTERRLTADLTRELEALRERLKVIEAVHYGVI